MISFNSHILTAQIHKIPLPLVVKIPASHSGLFLAHIPIPATKISQIPHPPNLIVDPRMTYVYYYHIF